MTRLALAERRWLCDVLESRGLEARGVIVADDDNLSIAEEYGFDVVECDNTDLGRRFNEGYVYALEHGADAICHVGSDDWVHPDVFDSMLGGLDLTEEPPFEWPTDGSTFIYRTGPSVLVQMSLAVCDLRIPQYVQLRTQSRHGCIPWIIPKESFEHSGGRPIEEIGHMRSIESLLYRGLIMGRSNWVLRPSEAHWCVDFKTDTNITPYDGLVRVLSFGAPQDPWAKLAEHYPQHLVDLAKETAERLEYAAA